MRVQIQTLTLIPWKGFILFFTSFLTLNELERICTLLRVLITKHTTTPQHILWDTEPAHPGHPWNCHTYPTVPSLMYSYFSNVSFPSNGNAYVIHAKGRFQDCLEVRHGSIKSKSTKPRNTEEGDMYQDTQFPSLARSCHAFIDLRVPSCISLLAQL